MHSNSADVAQALSTKAFAMKNMTKMTHTVRMQCIYSSLYFFSHVKKLLCECALSTIIAILTLHWCALLYVKQSALDLSFLH